MIRSLQNPIYFLVVMFLVFSVSTFAHAVTTTDSFIVHLTVAGESSPPPEPIEFVLSVSVIPGTNSVDVVWTTNKLSIGTVTWAPGSTIADNNSLLEHHTTLTNIDVGVTYNLTVFAQNVDVPSEMKTYIGTFIIEDTTPPANPLNFSATYDSGSQVINLSWQNPSDSDFDRVRIMRSTTFYPADEGDGELVYEGTGESAVDSDVTAGTTYYYTIFSRDTTGNWSSGAIDDEAVPAVEECVGEACTPPCEGDACSTTPSCEGDSCSTTPPCEGDACGSEDPFADFPTASTTIPGLEELRFVFEQNTGQSIFTDGSSVHINSQLNTNVWGSYSQFSEVLKTIGITLVHPNDTRKKFSFLLRVNSDKTRYTATIAPLVTPGTYKMYITILDYKNQKVKRLTGFLVVSGKAPVDPIISALGKFGAPIGQAVGIAVGLTETVVLVSNANSFYDVYLLLVRMIGALLGFLGVRKKRQPWGTVYDSVTKRPLDPAYVTVMQEHGSEIADAITDLDGRYGFLLPNGVYKINAAKTNYQFPSKKLEGKTSDELYDNLYHGEPISAYEGELVVRNIPLDPIGFDWNEFIKNQKGLYRLRSRRESFKAILFNAVYVLGFVSTLFAVIISPSKLNIAILIMYVTLFVFQFFWKRRHKAIRIIDKVSGEIFPYAVIRIYTADLNEQIKAIVADEFGRFFVLVSPGRYYLTVESKQADGTYKKVYTSETMSLKSGVITKDIVLNNTGYGTLSPKMT